MEYTVLGGEGFIGRALVKKLLDRGFDVYFPSKACLENGFESLMDRELGHLIYCIGLTADFRSRVLETIDAHVCVLNRVLNHCNFSSLTYLSSTRVYMNADYTHEEASLKINPCSNDSLYNISKIMGESACLFGSNHARVVRLSNVYGISRSSENFLMSVLREAAIRGKVTFETSPQSTKDYIALSDVVELLPDIANKGDFGIYNVASGINVSNKDISELLINEGVEVEFDKNARSWCLPTINIEKLSREFYAPQKKLLDDLPELLNITRREYG